MHGRTVRNKIVGWMVFSLVLSLMISGTAKAHCDTMDGPVIKAAQEALKTGNVKPVLIWVQKKDEGDIKQAFQKTLAVRKLNPEARELADHYFFETLVRIHRAGEGAPYTGLEPAGTDLGPAVRGADTALETGSVETLTKLVTDTAAHGIHAKFEQAMKLKKEAGKSVVAGREYVEAYVTYVHYVEGIYNAATARMEHHGHEGAAKDHEQPGE